MSLFVLLALAVVAPVQAGAANPIGKVVQLLTDLEAKIVSEAEKAKIMHAEFSGWCEDRKQNVGFEIATGRREIEQLKATIAKQTGLAESLTTKVEELVGSIAADEADLTAATEIRTKETAFFAAEEKELTEVIDTLDRAVSVIEREMQTRGSSMVQLRHAKTIVEALGVMVQASTLSSADASRLTALVQSSQEADETDAGAPDAAAYSSQSGSILDTLRGLQDKATEQLAGARKKEAAALHNFEMLKQSLEDEVKFANNEMHEAKKGVAASGETTAAAEGDLGVTSRDLDADLAQLQVLGRDCATKTEDFEAAARSRADELKALADAKSTIKESTGGAEVLSYGLQQVSLLQRVLLDSAADLKQFEAVRFLRDLAQKQNSAALVQLASQLESAIRFGARSGNSPFEKVKGLISSMIARLEASGAADASHTAYCDDETSNSEAKKMETSGLVEKLSSELDRMTANSAQLKEQVAALQASVAKSHAAQAEMNKLRQEEQATYTANKVDMERGIDGVEMAVKILREYYDNAKTVHAAAGGASSSIVGLLEVCMSDFTKGLADMTATEDAAQTAYDQTTRENKLETTVKDQDINYKSREAAQLDKAVAEATSDRSGAQERLLAILDYSAKLKEQCMSKAEPYAARKVRRDAELDGLRTALEILGGQEALVQTRTITRVRSHAQGPCTVMCGKVHKDKSVQECEGMCGQDVTYGVGTSVVCMHMCTENLGMSMLECQHKC